jgi:hypothetical protein
MTDSASSEDLPDRLESLLLERGWTVSAVAEGRYKRMSPQGGPSRIRQSLLIPTNPDMWDYTELLDEAVRAAVSRFSVARSAEAIEGLLRDQVVDDVIRFAKESHLPEGQISWSQGEAVMRSMRQSLVASAKATAEKAAYFGHKHSGYGGQFLEQVRMGQTEIGSFVVTAHTRANSTVFAVKGEKGRIDHRFAGRGSNNDGSAHYCRIRARRQFSIGSSTAFLSGGCPKTTSFYYGSSTGHHAPRGRRTWGRQPCR